MAWICGCLPQVTIIMYALTTHKYVITHGDNKYGYAT